jgi:hypothetical protein
MDLCLPAHLAYFCTINLNTKIDHFHLSSCTMRLLGQWPLQGRFDLRTSNKDA